MCIINPSIPSSRSWSPIQICVAWRCVTASGMIVIYVRSLTSCTLIINTHLIILGTINYLFGTLDEVLILHLCRLCWWRRGRRLDLCVSANIRLGSSLIIIIVIIILFLLSSFCRVDDVETAFIQKGSGSLVIGNCAGKDFINTATLFLLGFLIILYFLGSLSTSKKVIRSRNKAWNELLRAF